MARNSETDDMGSLCVVKGHIMIFSNMTDGPFSSSLSDEGHMASSSETDGNSPCIL
jgi:hypothetical protein